MKEYIFTNSFFLTFENVKMNIANYLNHQDNAFRAANSEDPLPCEDIEKIMKDVLIGACLQFFFLFMT